jgi:phosphatidylglycerophosphatase A
MKISEGIATLFGLGRVPVAPGTVASVVAVLLAWPIALLGGRVLVLVAAVLATAIGGWASELYARESHSDDPPECVVDELAGQWIACAFAPMSFLAFMAALALFRFFDVVKPWPISRLENLPGGLGVMADDIGAGVASGIIIALLAHARLI